MLKQKQKIFNKNFEEFKKKESDLALYNLPGQSRVL